MKHDLNEFPSKSAKREKKNPRANTSREFRGWKVFRNFKFHGLYSRRIVSSHMNGNEISFITFALARGNANAIATGNGFN